MPDKMAAMKTIAFFAISTIYFISVQQISNLSETAKSANAFVDSVGINVHLHDGNTLYAHFDLVEKALKDLGVRHIRDGLIDTQWTPYYDRLNELGKLGIKSTLITSPTQSQALLTGYPRRVPESFEAYEAPNEYDLSQDPDWAATLNSFLPKLYQAVKADPTTSRFPIVGPSLTKAESYPKVAASAPFFDYANLHNYFAGRNPGTPGWGANGYGSFDWILSLVRDAWPGKPMVTTETGYLNDSRDQEGIPEDVSAKYLPRLLLEEWMHGVQRTYLYQLLELGNNKFSDNSFGLVHSDFTPKAGYTALRNLLQLFSDPGPPFRLDDLDFSLSGDLANVHHVLLQKRNGTFYLALWVEVPSYDVNTKMFLPVAAHKIVVQTKQRVTMNIHELDGEGLMKTTSPGIGQSRVISVSDRVEVLEMSP